jgi:pSer/pThr/pTyr-binding forkhead associated (FHA) protein
MPKLVVTVEDQLLSEWPLDDQEVLIGRGPDCHVVVRDPLVSRHHAKIAKAYGGYFVEDLESTNGVTVNGRRVRKQMLKYGDRVQIGTHDLCLTAESADGNNDTERTVAIAPSAMVSRLSTPASSTLAPPSPAHLHEQQRSGGAYVKFNTGPNAGESEQIEKSLYSIGAPGGNLAVISRRGQVYVLQHLGGKRMSTLNGEPVSSAGVPLKGGDHIRVGDTQLEFHLGIHDD